MGLLRQYDVDAGAFRVPGGDRVCAAVEVQGATWRRDDADFVGRCVIVGTFEGELVMLQHR